MPICMRSTRYRRRVITSPMAGLARAGHRRRRQKGASRRETRHFPHQTKQLRTTREFVFFCFMCAVSLPALSHMVKSQHTRIKRRKRRRVRTAKRPLKTRGSVAATAIGDHKHTRTLQDTGVLVISSSISHARHACVHSCTRVDAGICDMDMGNLPAETRVDRFLSSSVRMLYSRT